MAHLEKNGNAVEWTTQLPERSLFIEAPCLVEDHISVGHRNDGIEMQASMVMVGDLGQIPLDDLDAREDAVRQELL